MKNKLERTKEDEKLLIVIMAHFYKEIPLVIERGTKITNDERANIEIEMYEELKKNGKLIHPH